MKRHELQMRVLVIGLLFGSLARAEPPAPAPNWVSPEVATDPTRMLAPPTGEGPVIVRATFALRDVNDIDDGAEAFQFSGILVLTWRDPRQAFDPREAGVPEKLYQGEYQFNEMSPAWYPQVVLANESGPYEKHGVLLRVLPDGTQTLYESVNAIAKTHFELRRLPFDVQSLRAVSVLRQEAWKLPRRVKTCEYHEGGSSFVHGWCDQSKRPEMRIEDRALDFWRFRSRDFFLSTGHHRSSRTPGTTR